MGVVYKAEDTKLRRTVALKFLPSQISEDAKERGRFVHEAQAASALSHPNVTTIYGIEESSAGDFIAMEHVEGRTLKQIVEHKTLSVKEVLDTGIQICEGLQAAHEKGIVHRDIKSANIMLTAKGQAKIMDFGLAKQKDVERITQTPSTLGTIAYMSPEQASGEEVDNRSDIFSFGVVMYELLTGRLPFEGEHLAAIIYSIINEEPQRIARFNNRVSEKLEAIVFKALAKDRDERYQHIDDLMADIKHERRLLDTTRVVPQMMAPEAKRKRSPILLVALAILVLALAVIIFKPFQGEIGPQRKAIAEENSLAIMYFENMADPEDAGRLGHMVTSLLITDLSESQYMRVISRQRLYDILQLMGKEDVKVIDRTVASEVARRAEVKWIMTGNILQTEPSFVLTAEISDASSGRIVASERVTGKKGEDIFAVVDQLSAQTKLDLALPEEAKTEPDRSVADVTTHSPEAYRQYLEGLDYDNKLYSVEAERSYREALRFDSTFAMAYFRLSLLKGDDEESRELIAQAAKYADRVSQKEKQLIKSRQATAAGDIQGGIEELERMVKRYPEEKEVHYWLGVLYYSLPGGNEQAIRNFHRAVEIDPLYKSAYNLMAYTYDGMGDMERSLWAINKYANIAPEEANPYDSRGDLYAYNGQIDQAKASYRQALEKKSDFYPSLFKLGSMCLCKKEYARAESCFAALSSSMEKEWRSAGRAALAIIPLYQGRLSQALEVLDDGIAADRMEQVEGARAAYKHLLKAKIYLMKENNPLALQEGKVSNEIQERASPTGPIKARDHYAYILAEAGEIAQAEKVLEDLRKDIEEKSPNLIYDYWLTLGSVDLIKGDAQAAANHLQTALEESASPLFIARVFLARAYLELGKHGEAVAELEKVLQRCDEQQASSPIWAVKAHYLLGLAYERSGWNKKAIEQYQEFLDIWQNADPGIEELEEARERLAKLREVS
jgi:TolB-like protein/predicted Zn-dependent protease/predicted Ser/Thr protein kinase